MVACGPTDAPEEGSQGGSSSSAGSTSSAEECPETVYEGDIEVTAETDLSMLAGLTHVTGTLEITYGAVSDLSFLGCLREVDYLKISSAELRSLEGLGRLETARRLTVTENAELTSLAGLTSFRHAGQIWIYWNPAITTLGLDQLETAELITIGECVQYEPFGFNPGLTDITGLGSLVALEELALVGNENLVSLDGLRGLASNGAAVQRLHARHNQSLPTQHIQEIADVLGAKASYCGNLGDPQEVGEDSPDPEYCNCGAGE